MLRPSRHLCSRGVSIPDNPRASYLLAAENVRWRLGCCSDWPSDKDQWRWAFCSFSGKGSREAESWVSEGPAWKLTAIHPGEGC